MISRRKRDVLVGLALEKLTGAVIAAAIEVHKRLGPGFLEALYEQALCLEMTKRGLTFESQKRIQIMYDGQVIGTHVLDLVVDGQVIVELKAVRAFDDIHYSQVRSYLRATDVRVGLLLNFGTPTLAVKRIVN